MWIKTEKLLVILFFMLLSFALFAQSDIGGVTATPIVSCETRLETCNQNWILQSNENLKLLNDITISKKSLIALNNKVKVYPLMLTDLQNKLNQVTAEREQYKIDLTSIKTDFEDVVKRKDADISKWRGRCIWVVIGSAALIGLRYIK
jgi:hypothetical protein